MKAKTELAIPRLFRDRKTTFCSAVDAFGGVLSGETPWEGARRSAAETDGLVVAATILREPGFPLCAERSTSGNRNYLVAVFTSVSESSGYSSSVQTGQMP